MPQDHITPVGIVLHSLRSVAREAINANQPNLSFSTPFSDFVSDPVGHASTRAVSTSSVPHAKTLLSFSTPYSDFVGSSLFTPSAADVTSSDVEVVDVSLALSRMSWASPESDMCAPTMEEINRASSAASYVETQYSFSSPFQDYCVESNHCPTYNDGISTPITLSYATPESDFTAAPMPITTPAPSCAYSFASPESDFCSFSMTARSLRTHYHPLGIVLSQLMATNEAIVITESQPPYRITHVNRAWEGLCGYSASEAVGQTLEIIQGPQTCTRTLSILTTKLPVLASSSDSTNVVLQNYTKSGVAFKNRLTVTPLMDVSDNSVTHLVGRLMKMA